jgi:hypothetical protein
MRETLPITPALAATIYRAVLDTLRGVFRPGEAPDFRMLGTGVHGIVVRGLYLRQTQPKDAWLKIVLDPVSFPEPDRIRRFNREAAGHVRAPRLRMRGETTMGHPWFIAEHAPGSPLLDPDHYDGRPLLSRKQRAELGDVFWDAMEAYLSLAPTSQGPSTIIWYDDKLAEWQQRGRKNGALAKQFIAPESLKTSVGAIHRASVQIPAPGTYYSHAHFSNPELRIAPDRTTLIDWGAAQFVPLMYDAAFWVWHAALHSWDVPVREWTSEVAEYEHVFCAHGRTTGGYRFSEHGLRHAFNAALAERMLASLLVDCAEGVTATLPLTAQRQILTNVRATLRRALAQIGT